MNINKGSLELSNSDFDNIISNITQGNSTLKSLEIELSKNGLSFKDFSHIQLNGNQMRDRTYRYLYSKIVCKIWNMK